MNNNFDIPKGFDRKVKIPKYSNNTNRFYAIEYLKNHLSSCKQYKKEAIADIVTAVFHYLSLEKVYKGKEFVDKILDYPYRTKYFSEGKMNIEDQQRFYREANKGSKKKYTIDWALDD